MIKLKTGTLALQEDEIAELRIAAGAIIGKTEAEEAYSAVSKLGGENKLKVIVFTQEDLTIDDEARAYWADDSIDKPTLAEAIVLDSFIAKSVINLLLTFHRTQRSIKLFTNEEDAIEWLKDL